MVQYTYLVYVHINKMNNKKYYGITCRKPEIRFLNGNGYKNCPYFYNAIQKYGWNGFQHKILAHGLTEKQARRWETKLIKHYKTNEGDYGYNMTDGGETNHHKPETCRKISENRKKNPNIRLFGEKNSFYGKHHSRKSRKQMSLHNWSKQHTKGNSPNAIKIYSLEENKVFDSLLDCAEYCNLGRLAIRHHCQNKTECQKFLYYTDYIQLSQEELNEKLYKLEKYKNRSKVVRISDGVIFDSVVSCAKENNLNINTLRSKCRNYHLTNTGDFAYYKDYKTI